MFKVIDPNSSIYAQLTVNGQSHVQEFPAGDERAFVVGSAERASLHVSGVAPVQFHIEREDGALWLIPAYGVDDLTIDWMRVLGPTPLDVKSVIEFCEIRIHVTLTEAERLAPEDDRGPRRAPDNPLRREDYSRNLPGEEDVTALAIDPVRGSASPDLTPTPTDIAGPARPSIEPRWSLSDDEDTPCTTRAGAVPLRKNPAIIRSGRTPRPTPRANPPRHLLIGVACIGAFVLLVTLIIRGRLFQ